ncbi:MAG: PAS domain S-box protein, partial [Syntrophales bacterium]|nr:PAS domain S-box protein [Syntrophales bacterium]
MKDPSRTNPELIKEIAALKRKIKKLEQSKPERKRVSKTVREGEVYFETIIQNSSDITIILDKLANITYASPSVERILGYRPEELIGTRTLDLIVSDDKSRSIADFGRALLVKGSLIPNNFPMKHKNGTVRILEGVGNNLLDNPIVSGFVMNARDITDRKQAEEQLKKSEEKYRTILEDMGEGYFEIDLAGNFTFVNDAQCRDLGYSRDELIGMGSREYCDEETAKKLHELFLNIYNTGKPVKGSPGQFISKDGRRHSNEVSASLIRDANDNPIGFRGISQDITDRKRAENEIHRNYDTQGALSFLLRRSLKNIPLEEMLEQALNLVISIPWLTLEAKGGIFLVEDEPEVLVMKAQSNLEEPIRMMCARVPFGKCLCGRTATMQKIQFSDHLDERHEISYEGMRPHGHYCVPIVSAGRTIGVINLYIKEGHRQDQKEEEFLTAIADSLAGIIERKRGEEKLKDTIESLRKSFGVTIQAMVSAIEVRDPYTAGHQIRSADLARAIATEMGLSQDEIDGIRMAGSIHDIGKLSIPADILSKPTKLSEFEFAIVQDHAEKGYTMLK